MLSAARIKSFFIIPTKNGNIGESKHIVYSLRDPPRYLKNRYQVIEYAKRHNPTYNISIVRFKGMPMKEQVSIVSACRLLVGVHGANLANLLYLQKGAAVLEIFPRLYPEEQPCNLPQCETYNTFAAHVGVRYFRIFGIAHTDEDNRIGGAGNIRHTGLLQRGKDLRRRAVVLKKETLGQEVEKAMGMPHKEGLPASSSP